MENNPHEIGWNSWLGILFHGSSLLFGDYFYADLIVVLDGMVGPPDKMVTLLTLGYYIYYNSLYSALVLHFKILIALVPYIMCLFFGV